jgi:AAA15 family ATPase/GTPase
MKIIKKIEIKHFRSIFDQEIIDLGDFNVFGGQNDSGKSNILKALNLFFNGQTSFLESFEFFADFSMFSKVKSREAKKGRQFISIKITFDENEIKGKDELKKLAFSNGGLWIEKRWWAYGRSETVFPQFIEQEKRQGVKRSFSVFLDSISFIYIPAFKNTEVFSYLLKLSAQNDSLFLSNAAKTELDQNIEKTTRELSSDFSSLTGVNTSVTLPISLESFWSSLEINSKFAGTPKIIKRGDISDYQIKFTSRGEGIKSIFIPVILGWLSRNTKSKYWIWGIDEPENALEALRADNLFKKFVEYAKTAQIFVSTHSPSFLFPQNYTETTDESVKRYITTQDKPGVTEFAKLENASSLESIFGFNYGSFLRLQKSHAEKISEHEVLSNQVEELKNKGNQPVLFVEGPSDKIIIENAWGKIYPSKSQPFFIQEKGNAKQVAYALENSLIFEKKIIFGVFDFDYEGYSAWNGCTGEGKPYKLITSSIPDDCLCIQRINEKHFGLLLPVPTNGDIRKQVISSKSGDHFGDRSQLPIELLFAGINSLQSHFISVDGPGGPVIEFRGDKQKFATNTASLSQNDFLNLKPLFEKIIGLISR